jgi:hypothetical protein
VLFVSHEAPLNFRSARKLALRAGYRPTAAGKHNLKLEKPGQPHHLVLSDHGGQDYGKGLSHKIRKQIAQSMEGQQWSSRSSSIKRESRSGPRSGSSRDASPQAEL